MLLKQTGHGVLFPYVNKEESYLTVAVLNKVTLALDANAFATSLGVDEISSWRIRTMIAVYRVHLHMHLNVHYPILMHIKAPHQHAHLLMHIKLS